jgi:hypothetical protein
MTTRNAEEGTKAQLPLGRCHLATTLGIGETVCRERATGRYILLPR